VFRHTSLGRWLVLPIALLCLASSNANATVINLTSAGGSGTTQAARDLFVNTDNQSTGTGVIQSFVRISGNTDAIEGYNTDARPLQYDENSSPTFTHSLQLSTVPIVTIGGVAYREFLLDINQTGTQPLLTLHELQIFMGNTGSPIGATKDAGTGTLSFGGQASLIYDLDGNSGGDSQIELNYNLNSGSGSGDMFAYIADSLFTGGTFVTLYSKFGPVQANNDGFEEWAVRTVDGGPPPVVPEPATIIAAFTGLPIGLLALRRRLRSRKDVTA